MTKRFNKFILLALALVMVLGMALPGFAASNQAVNVTIYKDGNYPGGELSMAQRSVNHAYITEETDGTYLIIVTKWFKFLGLSGTMQAMKYMGNNNQEIKSDLAYEPPANKPGQVKIKLEQNIVNDLNAGKTVELKDAEVKSTVKFGSKHFGNFKAVDFILSF